MVVFVGACDWAMAGHDVQRTHANTELTLSSSNVSQLSRRYRAPASGIAPAPTTTRSAPAVANGSVYVAADNGVLSATSAAGTTKCRFIPPNCDFLWFGTVPATQQPSSPAVANGTLFLGAGDGQVYAFNAAGCSAEPFMTPMCDPLRTYAAGGPVSTSPAITGGVLYVTAGPSGRTLYAFDATGVVNCSGSPKWCTPLWSATLGGVASDPTVAGGRVYVGAANGTLSAFDANGTANCAGSPRVCTPIWTATLSAASDALSTPAFAGTSVYVTSSDGRLHAVGTSGTELWRSSINTRVGAPAIAGGIVYSATSTGVEAFDAVGVTACTGAPKTCAPLWTAASTVAADTPAIANGVLYVGEQAGDLQAFDATGTTNCSGVPKTCLPRWSANAGTFITSSPVVANGAVFVRTDNLVGGSYNHNVDAFAIVGPRIFAWNGGIGPEFSVQGDHFPASTAGVVTVTDVDQPNDVATAAFTTAADGTFSTSATIPAWRCGDIVHVIAVAGTANVSYQTFVECQF